MECQGGECVSQCDAQSCEKCENGACVDKTEDFDECTTDCCVGGMPHHVDKAWPAAVENILTGEGCTGAEVDVQFTIRNTSPCKEGYFWTLRQPDPLLPGEGKLLGLPQSNSVALGPGQAKEFTVTVQIAPESPIAPAPLVLEVVSRGNTCPPGGQPVPEERTVIDPPPVGVEAIVDLDVDSDNSGAITEADDAIEGNPFSATSPGKWLWINNDDDNGNGVPDSLGADAGTIDHEDDLNDVAEMVIRAIDPAAVPAGAALKLTLDQPSHLRVFESRNLGAAQILGPEVGGECQVPIPTNDPVTLGIEGVSAGSVRLKLVLEDSGGQVLCSDEVVVTVVQVETVEWQEFAEDSTPLTTCPNNGGLRIFPDDTNPFWDPFMSERSKVALAITIVPPIAYQPVVQLRTFDVDDPFDQSTAHPEIRDLQLVDGDAVGPDNNPRGETDPGVGQWTVQTDANGVARHVLTLSTLPGNNYRACASTIVDGVEDSHVTQGFMDSGAALPWLVVSDMLTVWRRVWLELDSMERGKDIELYGYIFLIHDVLPRPPHDPDEMRVFLDIPELDDHGRFEAGSLIVLDPWQSFAVLGYHPELGYESVEVQGPVPISNLNKDAKVCDDDFPMILPRIPDVATLLPVLSEKFDVCYVQFFEVSSCRDITTPFLATMPYDATFVDYCVVNQNLFPMPSRWTVTILSGFQAYGENDDPDEAASTVDLDPDYRYHIHGPHPNHTHDELGDISATFGLTPVSYPADNVSLVLQETLRDFRWQKFMGCGCIWPGYGRGESHEWAESQIIAHEIGHQMGIPNHRNPGSLINDFSGVNCWLFGDEIRDIRASGELGRR